MVEFTGGGDLTLIEHWNGKTWSVFPSPNASGSGNVLNSVTSTTSKDVWAVGFYITKAGHDQTLAEHWDGKKWTIVPTPNQTTLHRNVLAGVAAVSAKDVVAVGDYYFANLQLNRALGEQWDGSKWTLQDTTSQGQYSTYLYSVAAVSPTEVVAVGEFFYPSGEQPYAERRTAVGWMTTITPYVGNSAALEGASTIPLTNDVWAVGGEFYGDGTADRTLVDRYHC